MSKKNSGAEDVLSAERSALQRGAAEVKKLSAALDHKLTVIEDWMGQIEGRASTQISVLVPDDPDEEFCLRLEPPRWKLEYRYLNLTIPESMQDPEWRLVLSASLDAKIDTCAALPALFGKMQDAQAKFISRLRDANLKLDEFANQVGLVSKEDE